MSSATRTLVVVALAVAAPARAQIELGHRALGAVGLDAGSQPPAGVYAADRFLDYEASVLVDKRGDTVPVGLTLGALADGAGAAFVVELPSLSTFFSVAVGAPLARVHVSTERPEASLDRFGLADLYFQPVHLGWRLSFLDVVTGFAVYFPLSSIEPGGRGSVGRGHLAWEPSLGATLFFDAARTWRLSALASYDVNGRNANVDVTRGDTLQVQGGFGKTLLGGALDVGVAAYALWQTTDDRGADVPSVVRGGRDFALGLGPELDVSLPAPRLRVGVRYEHDLAVRTRSLGEIFVVSVTAALR